uniref:Uncharacterized protein n=1 Tax=Anguilla anguilla TaxID=7936 RepID=A0A0E9WBV3_ANGAN
MMWTDFTSPWRAAGARLVARNRSARLGMSPLTPGDEVFCHLLCSAMTSLSSSASNQNTEEVPLKCEVTNMCSYLNILMLMSQSLLVIERNWSSRTLT